jgi:antitoxin component of MazEF toxin-antitoxin module
LLLATPGYNIVATGFDRCRSSPKEQIVIKQLRKVGNSNALILDKPILELLGIEESGEVRLTIERGSLVITPVNPRPVDEDRFEKLLDDLVERRRDVLQALAQ